ncbi:mitogen-activated protein kinase kinase kinase 5-like [Stigmatopora argus]
MGHDLSVYVYETNKNSDKVVLGKGTYGVVYAGRDVSSHQEDSRKGQHPLHEEICLIKRLKHRNIVQYLCSLIEDSFIKIFMEEVPGACNFLAELVSCCLSLTESASSAALIFPFSKRTLAQAPLHPLQEVW